MTGYRRLRGGSDGYGNVEGNLVPGRVLRGMGSMLLGGAQGDGVDVQQAEPFMRTLPALAPSAPLRYATGLAGRSASMPIFIVKWKIPS